MKKVRYLAGLAGLAPAAMIAPAAQAAVAAPAGHDAPGATTAAAKTVSLHHLRAQQVAVDSAHSCFDLHSGHYGWCNAPLSAPENLYSAGGDVLLNMPTGTRVKVTCYYNNSKGVIEDHIVRENISGTFFSYTGHARDAHVDFGANPWSVSTHGLAAC